MWKPLALAAAVVFASPAALAGNTIHFGDDDSCNIDLHHVVRIGPGFFEAREDSLEGDRLFHYAAPELLYVAGEGVTLDEAQQEVMVRYYGQLHEASRNVSLLSIAAVDIALQGVSIAITALAGTDHPDSIELKQTMADIRQRAIARYDQQDEVYVLGGPGVEDFVEQTIGEELEPRIEEIAKNSAGTLVWHALKAAVTGGRSIERQAEEAAEAAAEDIERSAMDIEELANTLCKQLEAIDETERAVHKAIPALAPFDLVSLP